MRTFEKDTDLVVEGRAIKTFVRVFGGSFKKLDQFDVDYRVFDKDGNLIAYAEVKGRNKLMSDAYPLPIAVRKISKLMDKRLNPVVIWDCIDGIIYGKLQDLVGEVRYGGRSPREGSVNDEELMVYYPKQKALKYIKFI